VEKFKDNNAFDSNPLVVSTLDMVGDMMDVVKKLKLTLLHQNKANQGIL
jgi:hypothetical protein